MQGVDTLLMRYAPALVALAICLIGAGVSRRPGRASWAPVWSALAMAAGWAVLAGWPPHAGALWAPRRNPDMLFGPALIAALVWAILAWHGRRRRLLLFVGTVFAGWWVARASVGTADFWRVWFAISVLPLLLGQVLAENSSRGLSLTLASWGGLVAAGAGVGWEMAALVAATAALGGLAMGKAAALPLAPVAALIGGADVAGGRLLYGRLNAIDVACAGAVAAPWLTGVITRRFGGKRRRFLPNLAAILAAFVAAAAVWMVRRAISS